ncbi:helix-turn-helix domain-containing protein [Nocardia sp. NPDC050435]|uniref:TOBE domain-containing protein n=1 Tax=Nocardia sp. NPDC050435 TaxID=3155040 RepID=UPI0033FFB4FD
MSYLRVDEVAELVGVGEEAVRCWIDQGKLTAIPSASGRHWLSGRELARVLCDETAVPGAPNRIRGLVTRIVQDRLLAQVELRAGPLRLVALLGTETVRALGLTVGCVAIAAVPSTQVVVEIP